MKTETTKALESLEIVRSQVGSIDSNVFGAVSQAIAFYAKTPNFSAADVARLTIEEVYPSPAVVLR